jgi:hypothetical protein
VRSSLRFQVRCTSTFPSMANTMCGPRNRIKPTLDHRLRQSGRVREAVHGAASGASTCPRNRIKPTAWVCTRMSTARRPVEAEAR